MERYYHYDLGIERGSSEKSIDQPFSGKIQAQFSQSRFPQCRQSSLI